jgi:nucleotide-binding universal stress UspA family protein
MEQPQRIVVGVDASAESEAALEWALAMAGAFGGSVVVVHAVGLLEEGGYRPRPDLDAIIDGARRRVPGPAATATAVFEDGAAADVVIRLAESGAADLIVVGRRGLGEAPRFLGSVSEAVVERARIPVLVVTSP